MEPIMKGSKEAEKAMTGLLYEIKGIVAAARLRPSAEEIEKLEEGLDWMSSLLSQYTTQLSLLKKVAAPKKFE